ncbi:EpsG family protein [Proteus terrae]|uniref:EpsG family protein n=1 Tax=Proteus terrae TaxID=1574161 RepID=UPI00288A0B09|nr:EpsG family protein [Proteus terrae]
MFYYTLFLFIIICLLFLSNIMKRNDFFFNSAIIISILFSGFRYNAGNDYFSYYSMIIKSTDISRLEIIPGFFINFAILFEQPFLFFLLSSSCYIFSISYFCKKNSQHKNLSFLLFLLLPLSFLTSFGYVRQFMSIGFYLVALSLFLNGKKKTSFLFMLLSVFSHSSSLIFIPFILFSNFLSKRKISLLISIPLIILSLFFSWLIKEHAYLAGNYQHYITGSNVIEAGKKIGYICFLILAYFYFFSFKIKGRKNIYFFNTFVIFVILYALLMDFGEYVVRITYILFPSSYILFAATLLRKKELKILQLLIITMLGFSMFYSTLYLASKNTTRDFLTNYSFIFLKDN